MHPVAPSFPTFITLSKKSRYDRLIKINAATVTCCALALLRTFCASFTRAVGRQISQRSEYRLLLVNSIVIRYANSVLPAYRERKKEGVIKKKKQKKRNRDHGKLAFDNLLEIY